MLINFLILLVASIKSLGTEATVLGPVERLFFELRLPPVTALRVGCLFILVLGLFVVVVSDVFKSRAAFLGVVSGLI